MLPMTLTMLLGENVRGGMFCRFGKKLGKHLFHRGAFEV
jgi:hypothetical protein